MKLLFPGLFAALAAVVALAWLWNASLARLWRRLGARPAAQFPVWREARERLERVAELERWRRAPGLWVIPEFAPNALVLRSRGGAQVAVTEGLLRALDDDELDAVFQLCLAHAGPRRRWQTALAMQLGPFARWLQSYPPAVQVFLAPWLTVTARLLGGPARTLDADRRSRQARTVAAALQKMAVLGRKIPLRHWDFALDPLFLISPLALDGGPFWVFPSQPSVEERRHALLGGPGSGG